MSMDMKAIGIVPLNGANYPTWKVQCQMALMKEGLWSIVKVAQVGVTLISMLSSWLEGTGL